MDRAEWLRERRRVAEERFDTLHAAGYDQEYGEIGPTHRRFVTRLLDRCPPGGRVLDAACGTGKYFGMVLRAGRTLLGCDQSAGMLAQANAKHPEVPTEKVGLQELAYRGRFDAVLCVDAMENVFPEDWAGVAANLRRALRPGGHLYLTVELADPGELRVVFEEAAAAGAPVVPGECHRGGGYHYYPPLDRVRAWLGEAGLTVLEEETDAEEVYHHLLALAQGPGGCARRTAR